MIPYPVHLDGRVMVKGTYDPAKDRTMFIVPVADPLIDTIILTDEFESGPGIRHRAGTVVTPSSVSGKVVTAPGRLHNRTVVIGRSCPMTLEPSRPFLHDDRGVPRVGDRFQIAELMIAHRQSGEYVVRSQMPGRIDRTKEVRTMPLTSLEDDEVRCRFTGSAKEQRITITSVGPRPVTIVELAFSGTPGVGRS